MRLPTRRAQRQKIQMSMDEPVYLTQDGVDRLMQKLERLEKIDLPQAIADVKWTGQFGDFSENAEYQEAKWRMRRHHDQITMIQERLKRVVVIQGGGDANHGVQLGCTVVLRTKDGVQKTFEIVGPQETDPVKGRLSFQSPLGAVLMNRKVGEEVEYTTPGGKLAYQIVSIE